MKHPVLVFLIVVCSFFAAAAASAQGPEAEAGKRALSLRECVGISLRTNPTILAAQGQSEAAAGRTKQARGPIYPQVTGSASTSRSWSESHQEVFGTSIQNPGDANAHATGVGAFLDQAVVDLPVWKNAAGARSSQRAAEASLRTSQEDVILEVERAYYGYLKTIHLEEVALENRRVGEEQLKLAEKRHEVGIGVQADILKAKAQNASDRLAVIIAQKNTKVARTTLCHVMGIELDTPLTIEDIDQNETIEAPPPPDVEAGLAERPEIVERRHQVNAAENTFSAAKGERYPRLGLGLEYQRLLKQKSTTQFTPEDVVSESDPYSSWRATLDLSMPIFRGGSIRGRINETRANLVTERELLDQAERDARLEIETASLNATAAAEAIGVSREGVAAAEEDLRVSQGSYTHGLVPILNLVEAQAALARAKVALVVTTYDYWIALGELDRALGRGMSKFAP
jgi:outer membrane protein